MKNTKDPRGKQNTVASALLTMLVLLASWSSCTADSPFTNDTTEMASGTPLRNTGVIQTMINAASPGDTLVIPTGIYYENIVINKHLTLVGEDRNTTVIDGGGTDNTVVIDAENVTITNFTIRHGGHGSVYGGISVIGHQCTTIRGNTITNNQMYGIHLKGGCTHTVVTHNTISNSSYMGIWVYDDCDDNTIVQNIISCSTKSGVYLVDDCDSNIITKNVLSENGNDGLQLDGYCCGNTVSHNTMINNSQNGIRLRNSCGMNTIAENTIAGNTLYGINIYSSSFSNVLYHNDLVDNLLSNARDVCGNDWDNGYSTPFNATTDGGNYWSDYIGVDNYQGPNQNIPGSDGIGDTPYLISGGTSQDTYPLIEPWGVSPPATVVYVDDDYNVSTPGWGYNRFNMIQDGIDAAPAGGTVHVFAGLYDEQVKVNKTVEVLGEETNTTIIDSGGCGKALYLTADSVTVSGFTIQHAEYGIALASSSNNTIRDTIVSNHDYGIYLYSSAHNTITENTAVNNVYGIILDCASHHNIVMGNHAHTNTIYGILLAACSNNTVIDNTAYSNNGCGIYLACSNTMVGGNRVHSNGYGIRLVSSDSNTVSENNVSNNDQGISLTLSNNNLLYHNTLLNNIHNAYDEGSNTWNMIYAVCGNYNDDYTGVDLYHGLNQSIPGPDGIGDTPYDIPGGSNQDSYPFMSPGCTFIPQSILIVYVDDDFHPFTPGWQYDHFDKIQDGIDAVDSTGTVLVFSGTYNEHVMVDKPIELIGEQRNTTTIDGGGTGTVVSVTSNYVQVTEFTVQHGGQNDWDAGIHLKSCHSNISKNIIQNNFMGVLVKGTGYNFHNVIVENMIVNNNCDGIHVRECSADNTIVRNTVSHNGYRGIIIGNYCYGNTVVENIISNNSLVGMNIVDHSNNSHVYHNNLIDNWVNARDECWNVWDDGYPSGGNYYDDYSGVDLFCGPNQDIPGSDGIGDTPYTISGGGIHDTYPFMTPNGWNSPLPPLIVLQLTVFLEGPFTGSEMSRFLNTYGYLPSTQPYTGAPWYYTGTENVTSIPNADIVDWVLIELRDAPGDASTATVATSLGRQAGFLLRDGTAVGLNGASPLAFFNVTITNNLYVVIYHRNHLSVMSAIPLVESGGVYTYNFTTGADQAYGGSLGHKQIGAGVWGMIGGDGNADGLVNNVDKNDVWRLQAGMAGYLAGDFTLNSQVDNVDKNDIWTPNAGCGSQVPT
ncbi:MAG: right-handed parallel beta-helix repeat-containing protein [Candidatus Thermoplasmatota archaeon]|nr:right-handed parallel beta-helix repeat-containing protein [Candidatus Thermoplasmatota archaeon]